MLQWVIYTCVGLLVFHFILYYCNVDIFQFFKKKKTVMTDVKESLESCINELKTLGDTIEDGCTDSEFPADTTPLL